MDGGAPASSVSAVPPVDEPLAPPPAGEAPMSDAHGSGASSAGAEAGGSPCTAVPLLRPAATLLDAIGFVSRFVSIHDLLNLELVSRSVWLCMSQESGCGAWKAARDAQFAWCNSTALFLLDVSTSKKQGVLGLLKEVRREVALGSPAWGVYKRRREAMRRFVASPCPCLAVPDHDRQSGSDPHDDGGGASAGAGAGTEAASAPPERRLTALERLAIASGLESEIGMAPGGVAVGDDEAAPSHAGDPSAHLVFNPDGSERYVTFAVPRTCDAPGCCKRVTRRRCFHGPIPTEVAFDGHLRRYCSPECEQGVHGPAKFSWTVEHLMGVLNGGSEMEVVREFGTAFGGFARLLFLSIHQNLPATRPRSLRRVLSILVRHRPDVFPVRTWSLVAPQFVRLFADLKEYRAAWSVDGMFRDHLRWYELIEELQQLMLRKTDCVRQPLVDLCQVPPGAPTGIVNSKSQLTVNCVQYPIGIGDSSSGDAGGGSGGGRGRGRSTGLGGSVGTLPRSLLLMSRTPVRSASGRSWADGTPRSFGGDSPGRDGGSSGGGGGGGGRRPLSPLNVSADSYSSRMVATPQSPALQALSVTAGASPRARRPRGTPRSARGSSSPRAAASRRLARLRGIGRAAGTDGGGSPGSSRDGGAAPTPGRGSPKPLSPITRPRAIRGRTRDAYARGSSRRLVLTPGGPRAVRDEDGAGAGGGAGGGPRRGSGSSSEGDVADGRGSDPASATARAAGGDTGRAPPRVDAALVWFVDALLRHGGVACVTAWRWLHSNRRLRESGSYENLVDGIATIFKKGNGLALLCAAIDCPQPVNGRRAAHLYATMLRVVGLVSFSQGTMTTQLNGSPLVSVWCKRAGLVPAPLS